MPVTMPSQMSIKQHVLLCWKITVEKKWIILMWPLAFGTNYYVIYQSNRYNGVTFSVRGRALNTLISGLAQVSSTWTTTALVDWVPLRRRQRAYIGVAFNLLLTTGVWIGGYYAMEAGLPADSAPGPFCMPCMGTWTDATIPLRCGLSAPFPTTLKK